MRSPSTFRRRFQFSLRSALIFVAVVSALLGWRVKTVRDMERAVVNLRQAGFSLSLHEPAPPPSTGLCFVVYGNPQPRPHWQRLLIGEREWEVTGYHDMFHGTGPGVDRPSVGDATISALMDALRDLGSIHSLTLSGSDVGNDSLRQIAMLDNVTRLYLRYAGVTGDGLGSLEAMTRLEELHIWGIEGMSSEGIARLQKALPNCKIYAMDLAY